MWPDNMILRVKQKQDQSCLFFFEQRSPWLPVKYYGLRDPKLITWTFYLYNYDSNVLSPDYDSKEISEFLDKVIDDTIEYFMCGPGKGTFSLDIINYYWYPSFKILRR